ncbi:hypothetical protein K435DRAFT_779121 [Dendrothele bispora CBS 962.96]|uniref:Uncharacterized protein n=1 Tax=Dendrothele bispora (strain CBS 962.96) TaxID=1314807 RepID=A0A4S8LZQ5_DENBC|nr:hypothetical protein K435DRAFT_779121 [Dendrothele bispora CBS 962.96]
MSLSQAPKDVSANPQKGSVIDPVDKNAKDADVERKLKLYTAIQALRDSRLPSNAQFDAWLDYAIKNSPVESYAKEGENSLSPAGRKLLNDFRDILDDVRVLVKQKNGDELLQEFVWGTRDKSEGLMGEKDTEEVKEQGKEEAKARVDKVKAKEDANQAATHLRTLLHLLLTNSEARKLVSDLSLVGRDLLSKGLSKAALGIAPDEERLAGVDEAHHGDEFISKEQQEAEKAKAEEKKAKAKQAKEEAKADGGDALKNVQVQATEAGPTTSVPGVAVSPTSPGTQAMTTTTAAGTEAATSPATAEGQEAAVKKKGLFERMKEGFSSSVPQEHQDKAKSQAQRGREFMTQEYFPKERRDQWIWRAKKVILECQKHQDYQDSLRWLIEYLREYAGHGRHIVEQQGSKGAGTVKDDPNLQTSLSQLRALLERLANGKSLQDHVWDPVNALIDDAQRDSELREWWSRVTDYIEKVLLTPGYIMEPACNTRGNELLDEGRRFYGSGKDDEGEDPYQADTTGATQTGEPRMSREEREAVRGKYREHLDRVFEGLGNWLSGIREDPLNKRLGTDVQRFAKDLLFSDDGEGQLVFKAELWNDVRDVIVPMLVDRVGYIPIPRIEYTDDALDLVVENLTLSGRNLFPNFVDLESHNHMRFSPYKNLRNKSINKHEFTFTLGQIQADMRDVAFYFRKKSGIPKLKDSGIADVTVGGEGLTATVHLTNTEDPSTLFAVKSVNVKVDNLKFSIRDSKHDLLYKTLKPLATGLIKRQIQKAVEDGLRSGLEWVGEELITVKERMNEAKANVKEGEAQEEIGRFKALQEAFKRRRDDVSVSGSSGGAAVSVTGSTAPSHTSHSQFKVVSNKRNSILAHAGRPEGWANRVAEKEKLVSEGEGWKSKAFDVVN